MSPYQLTALDQLIALHEEDQIETMEKTSLTAAALRRTDSMQIDGTYEGEWKRIQRRARSGAVFAAWAKVSSETVWTMIRPLRDGRRRIGIPQLPDIASDGKIKGIGRIFRLLTHIMCARMRSLCAVYIRPILLNCYISISYDSMILP